MTSTTLEAPVIAQPPSLEDDGERYEIIDGKRVELPPPSVYASRMTSWLLFELYRWARANDLGECVSGTLFRMSIAPERLRRVGAAFVSYQRWPKNRPLSIRDEAWDVVPDLAIEVVSPTDFAEDLLIRLDQYFRAGVQLLWVVYPSLRLIYVYESMTRIRVITTAEELDGGAVLPGFRVAAATLYPATDTDEAPQA